MIRSRLLGLPVAVACALAGASASAQTPPPTGAAISAPSGVPRSTPFSGQLLTATGEARTGTVLLTFGLYTDATGGTPLWTEQQLVALDGQGRYAVVVGAASTDGLPADAFAAGSPRWLGVQAAGEPEQPRIMLLSVPYALKAADADTVGGRAVTDFVTAAHVSDTVKSAIKDATAAPNAPFVTPNALVKYANSGGALTESSAVDVGGKFGIQVAVPQTELDVAGGGSSTTITLRNGGSAADVVKLVGSDGSLRIGSATTANLVNLIGPNLGVGTTTPISKLHVSGSSVVSTTFVLENLSAGFRQAILSTYGSAGGGQFWPGLDSANTSSLLGSNLFVLRATGGLAFSGSSAAEHMRISSAGKVGIGTVAPAYRFEVQGSGNDAVGVFGAVPSASGTGVFGYSATTGTGLLGISHGGFALSAENFSDSDSAAVNAVNHAASGFGDGVRASTSSGDAVGLWARNLAANGTAARFDGNVAVYGNLTKSSGSFKIDHPLDPENRYLYHSFVESPDMMNIYNGVVTTDAAGDAIVTLPDWFEALNGDFRYQLTCIGTFAQAIVSQEVANNRFAIKTSIPGVKVSWQITGIRHDAWANTHRIPVEEIKQPSERGTYLHPEAFGQPAAKGVESRRDTDRRQ